MPPPQCPECGRFLATAFVEQITSEPAPCPGCGTELSLAPEEPGDDAATPEASPPVPPPAATLPADGDAGAGDALDDADDADQADEPHDDGDDDVALGATTEPASTTAPTGEEVDGDAPPLTPAAAALPDDVEPEPTTSVRPPDRTPDPDPLAGWDEAGTLPAPVDELDPVELAIGAGAGLLLGLLLGGRRHRGLGALLGALLGAMATRLRD